MPYQCVLTTAPSHWYCRCWTRNKYDKLHNFRAASMWYVKEDISEVLGALGNTTFTDEHRAFLDKADVMEKKLLSPEERARITNDMVCKPVGK